MAKKKVCPDCGEEIKGDSCECGWSLEEDAVKEEETETTETEDEDEEDTEEEEF